MAKRSGRTPQNTKDNHMDASTQPSTGESATELRDLAIAFEIAATEGLAGLAELEFPLSTGNLKEFPRPVSELRSAEQGLEYLREAAERASAMLAALAAAQEQGLEISPVLRAAVEPFISAVRAQK
jgi:hypothetical protein